MRWFRCLIFLLLLTGGAFYLFIIRGLPGVDDLKRAILPPTIVFSADNTVIGRFSALPGRYVKVEDVPEYLINAVIATEDKRFFRHHGLDYFGILRAALRDILSGEFKEGGSTITQQLAKILYLSHEKSLRRKLKELVLAIKLERALTKRQILEIYLNRAYFGWGAYGVEDASRLYFGKSVRDLNLKEAALLAGLLKSPNYYSPFRDLKRAEARANLVLRRMEEEGYLKPSQRKMAERIKLRYRSLSADFYHGYFLQFVRQYLEHKYGDLTYKGGLRVFTTLDTNIQKETVNVLRKALQRIDMKKGWRGPLRHTEIPNIQQRLRRLLEGVRLKPFIGKTLEATVLRVYPEKAILDINGVYGVLLKRDALWARKVVTPKGIRYLRSFSLKDILRPGDVIMVEILKVSKEVAYAALRQQPLVQGAVVVMEPDTGYIRAMVGGYDFRISQFNRAVSARRQAGSLFKPVLYALAIEKGLTPATILRDEPLKLPRGDGTYWSPQNYDRRQRGIVNLREALVYSLNIPTVRIAQRVGIDDLIRFTESLGFRGFPRDLTLSLGSLSVSPIQMAEIYTAFANHGIMVKGTFIRKVLSNKGVYLEVATTKKRRVISDGAAYIITDILREAVKRGTGQKAYGLGHDVAGKTGTTDNYRDAWFIGYTPDLLAVVWIGYDDARSLGKGMTGGEVAAPVWKSIMKKALQRYPKRDFERPPSVVTHLVDKKSGLRVIFPGENTYREVFIRGKEPGYKTIQGIKEILRILQKEKG